MSNLSQVKKLSINIILVLAVFSLSGFRLKPNSKLIEITTVFSPPLGFLDSQNYAPRINYENGSLIENTDYGVQNPDLSGESACFGVEKRLLRHAGEDLYRSDGQTTAGREVTAIADGVVIEYNPAFIYPGNAIVIEHTLLPSGDKVYSVYIHLDNVQIVNGQTVSRGQLLGYVINYPYEGNFMDFHNLHYSGDDSHLHFEIRYFANAGDIYQTYNSGQFIACDKNDKAGRGYTHPDINPDNFPAPGAGYTDPTDFINSHSSIPTATPTLPPSQNVGISISQGSDDGGTNPGDCAFSNTDNEVYLGACFNGGDITSGFRFNNIQIPRNANIERAYIHFTVDGTYTAGIQAQIYGEASSNPLTYSLSSPPTNRLTTFNSALWRITDQWEFRELRDTPDISSVIQEIINRPDWISGRPISIIIKNAGSGSSEHRRVIGFERVSFDPSLSTTQLVITYNTNPTPTPTATPLNNTPQPGFTATSIPPTYTHIAPTIAPTNPPEPKWCVVCGSGCQSNSAQGLTANGTGLFGTPTPYATTPTSGSSSLRIAETVDLTTLLYRVRDEILSTTPEGQRLTDLYYAYIPNIIQVLMVDPTLSDQSIETMNLFVPALEALLDGNGDTVTITSEQVTSLQSFLNTLVEQGDPELQAVILSELERRPLENMVGMTMDEAWRYTNGYQLEWLPPISNSNPYNAQLGSTIPVKFTATDFDGNFVIDESLTLQVLDSNGNVVVGPIEVGNDPNNAMEIQGSQYHYNLNTNDLPEGSTILQVTYNSSNGVQSETRSITLTKNRE